MTEKEREQLATAIDIAVLAHRDVDDKCGVPYILHPMHVMMKFQGYPIKQMVAALHDVLEDTELTADYLRNRGIPEEAVEAIIAMSRKEGQSWAEYLMQVKQNEIAVDVKIEDLAHNGDPERLVMAKDQKRASQLAIKYAKASFELHQHRRIQFDMMRPGGEHVD